MSKNAGGQKKAPIRKRTLSASPAPVTKKVKREQKSDMKTSELKRSSSAPPVRTTKRVKTEQNIKPCKLTGNKVVQDKKPARKRTKAAAVKNAKLQSNSKTPETECQNLSSKADRKDTEKVQPKLKRGRQQKSGDAKDKERKLAVQRGRNKQRTGKKTKRNMLRSPLPSFDDDDDDFKLCEKFNTGKRKFGFAGT